MSVSSRPGKVTCPKCKGIFSFSGHPYGKEDEVVAGSKGLNDTDKPPTTPEIQPHKKLRKVQYSPGVGWILIAFVFLWFGGIGFLNVIMKIFVVPTLSKLENTVQELTILEKATNGDDIYLVGLKIKHPIQELSASVVAPIFENHLLHGMSIFLKDDTVQAGNILIFRQPDVIKNSDRVDSSNSEKLPDYTYLFNKSMFGLYDSMFRTKMSDFSWWNLIGDVRVVYLLMMKSIMSPMYFENGNLYHIKTSHFSGYLYRGEYGKNKNGKMRHISELWFERHGTFFNIIALGEENRDFSEFISNLEAVSEAEADVIMSKYNSSAVSQDIELASKLSRRLTTEDLEKTVTLLKAHKAAGDKIPNTDFEKELLYLKNAH